MGVLAFFIFTISVLKNYLALFIRFFFLSNYTIIGIIYGGVGV